MMFRLRRKWPSSRLLPDFWFIRTLQSPWHLVRDDRTGRYIISDQAFKPGSDGTVSGDLEQVLAFDGLEATAMQPAAVKNQVGAASLTVRQIRDEGAQVEHDPDPESCNWYHGALTYPSGGRSATKRIRKKLGELAVEIIPVDQQLAEDFFKRELAASASATAPGA
jgi:hypothetical protein